MVYLALGGRLFVMESENFDDVAIIGSDGIRLLVIK